MPMRQNNIYSSIMLLMRSFFFYQWCKNHRRQTTNPTQTQPTNTQTKRKPQQRTQAGRPWASRPPPRTREAALDQLAQRQPSSNRARPTEAPKTQPNNDEQQTQQPKPKPRQTKPNHAPIRRTRRPVCGGKLGVQCQGFAIGLSVAARIAQLTPGNPC